MLIIENLGIRLTDSKKEIIRDLSLKIREGEIHLINGKNGSGKSTLVNTIMGHPAFEISKGSIKLINEEYNANIIEKIDKEFVVQKGNNFYDIDLTNLEPNERSLAGVYLANQYPLEIPGVDLMSYMRMIYNLRRDKEDQLSVYAFKNFIELQADIIKYPHHLLKRNLNEGFSGGEKKKTEILQMLILRPRYILLDEVDSGLDKSSVQEVFEGISEFKKENPHSSFIIITHYDRAKEFLQIDQTHEMDSGIIQNF